ncbi:hypothetical protein OKW41_001472 [Paraburkholderia sp. UCT70]|uniref:hypothetical protein n=1 Tax=Paraburkholderia sp. UCT70 TaxID=2991068 RepID=UPI003D249DD7
MLIDNHSGAAGAVNADAVGAGTGALARSGDELRCEHQTGIAPEAVTRSIDGYSVVSEIFLFLLSTFNDDAHRAGRPSRRMGNAACDIPDYGRTLARRLQRGRFGGFTGRWGALSRRKMKMA